MHCPLFSCAVSTYLKQFKFLINKPSFRQRLIPSSFQTYRQKFVTHFWTPHACYMSLPSLSSSFDRCYNIWWRGWIIYTSPLRNFLHFLSLSDPCIHLSTSYSYTLNLYWHLHAKYFEKPCTYLMGHTLLHACARHCTATRSHDDIRKQPR
jgi:hypothetical protein